MGFYAFAVKGKIEKLVGIDESSHRAQNLITIIRN